MPDSPLRNLLQSNRQTYLRGETATVTVLATGRPPGPRRARLAGVNVPGSWELGFEQDGSIRVDTGIYRAGEYVLSFLEEETVVGSLTLHLCEPRLPATWFGNYLGPPARAGYNPYAALRDLGMNAAYLWKDAVA